MTFLPENAWAKTHLAVRYRGSPDPQRLKIRVDTPWPLFGMRTDPLPIKMDNFVEMIRRGVAAGEHFDPRLGKAEYISGPKRGRKPVPEKSDYQWELEVAGVSPLALRNLIETFSGSIEGNQRIQAMVIEGSLPLDASAVSVTEKEVASWLDDSETYLGEWEQVPFALTSTKGKKDAVVKVTTATPATKSQAEQLEDSVMLVGLVCFRYPDRKHKTFGEFEGSKVGRTRSAISVTMPRFTYDAEFVRAALVNMLVRFHHDVVPLTSVELTLP